MSEKRSSSSTTNQFAMTLGAGRRHRSMAPVEKPKSFKQTVKRLLKYLWNYRFKLLVVVFLVILSTTSTLLATRLIGIGVDKYILNGDLSGLLKLVFALLGLYVIASITTWAQTQLCIIISQQAVAKIRKDVFTKLQKLPLKYFDTRENGEIMSRITNDVDNIGSSLNVNIAHLISSVLTVIGILYFMISISPILTLVNFVTIPTLTLFTKLITKHSKKYFKEQQIILGKLNGKIEETISGQKVVKTFVMEKEILEEFNVYNNQLKNAGIKAQMFSGFLGPISSMINNIGYGLVAVIGGVLAVFSMINLGSITSFLIYSRQFGRPFNEIAQQYNSLLSAIAGAERVFEILDENEEPSDVKNAFELNNIKGNVDFVNVSFGYTEKNILKNINLSAKAGQTIALVGPTGAGKTTIINLLTRFYDINEGEIFIDNTNIKDIKRNSLRSSLGIVLQDTYLFSGNIMENIRYGRLTATDEEVISASKLANAHEFIKRLPHGYKTVLTEDADNLSQGQKQMLAIARAILANHPILILDEATSNVDTRTEVKIQQAMLNLMKGRTSFVIAHRLSTIRNADLIVVINNGEIEEKGNHKELLEKKGFYYNLYTNQFSD